MATTTTNLSLIKPAGSDFVLITDINTNSDTIDAAITKTAPVATVTALPGSPTNGQVIFYQSTALDANGTSMALDGIVWQLRYNSSSASSYKWEFVGGGNWVEQIPTDESIVGTNAFVNLATVGPKIAVPIAGEYEISFGATQYLSVKTGTRNVHTSIKIGAAATDAANESEITQDVTGSRVITSRTQVVPVGSLENIILQYKLSVDTGRWKLRWLSVRPVRVG